VRDVDGNEYADFCLGDTGAMAGHSPEPAMAALRERAGIRAMLPTADAEWVGSELARRFGLPPPPTASSTSTYTYSCSTAA
jgi:glutamate-1-semialdehyde 2,1-aminomutase